MPSRSSDREAETPEENVMALMETARRFGRYRPDGTLEHGL